MILISSTSNFDTKCRGIFKMAIMRLVGILRTSKTCDLLVMNRQAREEIFATHVARKRNLVQST